MPRLTARVTAQGILVDGLFVNASLPRLTSLKQDGNSIPDMQEIKGLIDTGATTSCLDTGVIARLGLSPTGFVGVHTSFSGDQPEIVGLFDVSIWLGSPKVHALAMTLPVLRADLSKQTVQCLIGMDVLRKCILHIDGPKETADLIYPVDG